MVFSIRETLYDFFYYSNSFKEDYGDILKTRKGTYGFSFWKRMQKSENKAMQWISEQALQFISISSGESDCERSISMTRSLSDSKRNKEKEELTMARVILGICSASRKKSELFLNESEFEIKRKGK